VFFDSGFELSFRLFHKYSFTIFTRDFIDNGVVRHFVELIFSSFYNVLKEWKARTSWEEDHVFENFTEMDLMFKRTVKKFLLILLNLLLFKLLSLKMCNFNLSLIVEKVKVKGLSKDTRMIKVL